MYELRRCDSANNAIAVTPCGSNLLLIKFNTVAPANFAALFNEHLKNDSSFNLSKSQIIKL